MTMTKMLHNQPPRNMPFPKKNNHHGAARQQQPKPKFVAHKTQAKTKEKTKTTSNRSGGHHMA
jgi:hypothetical protein